MEDNTHESRSEWTIRQRLVCRSTYRARNWSTQRRATGARDKLVTAGKALWLVLKECRVKRTSDTTQTRYVYVPLYACTGTSRDARDAFMHGTVDTDARKMTGSNTKQNAEVLLPFNLEYQQTRHDSSPEQWGERWGLVSCLCVFTSDPVNVVRDGQLKFSWGQSESTY